MTWVLTMWRISVSLESSKLRNVSFSVLYLLTSRIHSVEMTRAVTEQITTFFQGRIMKWVNLLGVGRTGKRVRVERKTWLCCDLTTTLIFLSTSDKMRLLSKEIFGTVHVVDCNQAWHSLWSQLYPIDTRPLLGNSDGNNHSRIATRDAKCTLSVLHR